MIRPLHSLAIVSTVVTSSLPQDPRLTVNERDGDVTAISWCLPVATGFNLGRLGPLAQEEERPPVLEHRELGRPAYGVENANTWWELLIPHTPPFPTLMERREPGTCTKFNVLGSKR